MNDLRALRCLKCGALDTERGAACWLCGQTSQLPYESRSPEHGPWCGGQEVSISCPHCGDPVWRFICNHSVSGLFDQLTRPWDQHFCFEGLRAQSAEAGVEWCQGVIKGLGYVSRVSHVPSAASLGAMAGKARRNFVDIELPTPFYILHVMGMDGLVYNIVVSSAEYHSMRVVELALFSFECSLEPFGEIGLLRNGCTSTHHTKAEASSAKGRTQEFRKEQGQSGEASPHAGHHESSARD